MASQTFLASPSLSSAIAETWTFTEVCPVDITIALKLTHSPPNTGSENTTSLIALVTEYYNPLRNLWLDLATAISIHDTIFPPNKVPILFKSLGITNWLNLATTVPTVNLPSA